MLCLPLYSLYTHDCVATFSSNAIYKFINNTAVVGQLTDGDELEYRKEIDSLLSGAATTASHSA